MLGCAIELFKIDCAKNSEHSKHSLSIIEELESTVLNRSAFQRQHDSSAISRGHKFYYVALTTLGYKDIELEKPMVGGLFNCDLYIPSLDMVIDVHGPVHYLN